MNRWLRRIGTVLAGIGAVAAAGWLYLHRAVHPGSLEHPRGFHTARLPILAAAVRAMPVIDMRPPLPDGVVEQTNVVYGTGGGRPLHLDLCSPAKIDRPAPAVLFIHGGAWRTGKRQDYRIYTTHFAKLGYVTATASYRLFREAPYPAAVQDVKCAVRWLRANAARLHIDPERIAVAGGSAGGHLSMLVGYAPGLHEGDGGHAEVSSKVAAVVDIYGPADLTTPVGRKASVVKDFLGGKSYDEAPALWQEASPITHLRAGAPPTLILHGTLDEVVPIGQSDLLAARLKELGVPAEYERIDGWPHVMDASLPVNEYFKARIARFLEDRLRR
jgi:acetyl esterase/lipase